MNRVATACWIVLTCLLLSLQAGSALAQSSSEQRISLLADQVTFDPTTKVLIASGNVQIIRGEEILTTDRVVYDQKNKRITVPGPLVIAVGEDLTTRAKSAVLDEDLQNGLIRGAEVLISQQLQLVSEEFHRIDGRFKVLTKSVGSSCRVCKKNPVPFWQIRSRRVIHDELARRLYFENATMTVLGVPVFYTPKLRVPDPTVDRATGFLVPHFSTSNTLGYGIEIPYFVTLGDHADMTFSPEFYSKGSILVNTQFRRRYSNGQLSVEGAFTLADDLTPRTIRSSLSAEGYFQLSREFELDFGIEVASDDDFRSDYAIGDSDQDRLTSFLTLRRTRKNSYVSISTSYNQSLRSNEVDQEIPLVLPEFFARKTWADPYLGGTFGLTAQSVTLLREDGSEFVRAGLNADWQKDWIFNNGLIVTAHGELANSLYYTQNYPAFGNSTISESTPLAALDFRLPLSRQTGRATHVIEPRVQLVWSPDRARSNPNEDSTQVEFEETNLFSYNRFPGFDDTERGLRANIGVSYNRYDPEGWNYGVTIGRILRAHDLGQFSTGTGIDSRNSDYVSAFRLSYQDKVDFVNRTLFDNDFNLSKNEAQLALNFPKLSTAATYVWLEADVVAGASDPRHEATVEAEYRHSDYWTYLAQWRHNLLTGKPTSGEFGVRYENECVAVNLSLSLQYAGSGIVRPTREIGLSVELAGFGNKKRNKKYAHRCSTL
ncbi:MAG: LPS-assembly protein LptD [Rhodobacteraceae bacterium]|nr:LPS-assembly protein LptD [Paracoccaceae bacterium]